MGRDDLRTAALGIRFLRVFKPSALRVSYLECLGC